MIRVLDKKISIKDACNLIGTAKDVFAPIKEAITNSLDAIIQRQETKDSFQPKISIVFYYKTKSDLFSNTNLFLDSVSIEDNGIGFTSKNLYNFKQFASPAKGLNNRGTGLVQVFCRFHKLDIDSVFFENNEYQNYKAYWKIDGTYNDEINKLSHSECRTKILMSKFNGSKEEEIFYTRYLGNIDELKKDILKNFLLRLWLSNKEKTIELSIQTILDGCKQKEYIFNNSNIPNPDKEESIIINTEQANIVYDKNGKPKIEWIKVSPNYPLAIHRFKLPASDISENAIYLCSKNIMVENFKFSAIRKKDSIFNGYRYLTCICGDLLNSPNNVNHTVDHFIFPSRREVEKDIIDGNVQLFNQENKFVFNEEIHDQINNGLVSVYSDVQGLKELQEKNITELAKKYGISIEDAEAASVSFNDSDEETIEKLFTSQAKRFAQRSIEIQNNYDEITELETSKLNPISPEYREKFNTLSEKLLSQIPQQNKDELARYIIRRDMVVKLLKLALNNDLMIQKEWINKKNIGEKIKQDQEGIIHDLIFKRRISNVPTDLWILNEEFVHFEGYSDTQLEKLEINGEKLLRDNIDIYDALKSVGIDKNTYVYQRPDIFLFPEEGKCILIEFKAPYEDLSQHTTQIPRYAKLIANYSRKPFTQFFGYLIGEKIDLVNLDTANWKKVPYGNYRIYPNYPITTIDDKEVPIANLYQEMMPFSEILKRATIRNKSFSEKLGINNVEKRDNK